MTDINLATRVNIARDVIRKALREQLERSIGNLPQADRFNIADELLETVCGRALAEPLRVISVATLGRP